MAPNESPTFAHTFNAKKANCLLSKRLIDSRAKEDMVVNDPQKPTANRIVYFVSRLKLKDKTEKNSKYKTSN